MSYLPRIFSYLRPYWRLATVSVALIFLGGVVGLLVPWPLAVLIDNVLGSQPLPPWLELAVGPLAANRSALLGMAVVAGLLITLLQNALTVFDNYVNTKLDQRMALDFRSDLFQHAQRLSMAFHDRRRSGMLIYAINSQADAVPGLVMAVPPIAQSVITLVGMFWILLTLDPWLAVVSLTVVPFLFYSVRYYATHIQDRLLHVRNMECESLSIVHEAISMLRVIVAFGREDHEYRRFREQGERAIEGRVKLTVRQTLFLLAVNMTTAVGTALVLWIGASHVLGGKLQIGQLLVVMAYIASVYKPLEAITHTAGTFQEKLVNLRLAFHLLNQQPEIDDAPGAVSLKRARGDLAFDDVHFSYQGRVDTLSSISFEARAGEVVAIVGPTGAGKTTLISLIPRFYDQGRGHILLDGVDSRQLTLRSLRDQISLVLQEPLLFSGTIADNIRYGRLEATMDEVVEAARNANAHDFIMRLPHQYETELGERGAKLSGGERQRVCIARAFLKDAPILILDEPTSAIDSKTEAVILDALDRLMVGRTTFLIAHRLSTVRKADLILVMEGGRLVERGTHDQLLLRGGLYKQLHDLQHAERRRRLPGDSFPLTDAAEVPRMIATSQKRKIVLLGMMSRMPVAGVVWQTLHYLLGFQRLGYDVYYVETHGTPPRTFFDHEYDNGFDKAAAFIDGVLRRFDLQHHWAYRTRCENEPHYGLNDRTLDDLYRSAELIVNLHGGTEPLPEHGATGRLVYLETDPVEMQVQLHNRSQAAIDYLTPHCAFFTFGENYGHSDCLLPVCDRFRFLPTRQPVLCDFWRHEGNGAAQALTTIGNWRQPDRTVRLAGEDYYWSKHYEFLKFLDLPSRTRQPFELALSSTSLDDESRRLIESKGWRVRDSLSFSGDADAYRKYITASRGEFTVAKDQNIRLRSGWFSDRSATYLAAGRPVITQETGFSNILPTGRGLFAFSTLDEAANAVEQINADYALHSRAAREIAEEYFSAERVLGSLLERVGL